MSTRTLRALVLLCCTALPTVGCGSSADGRVLDARGDPAADCHVASVLAWNASGRVATPPAPAVTRTGSDGTFTLPRLPDGAHLLVAVRPLGDPISADDVARIALEVAAGARPEGCLVGVAPLTLEGRGLINSHSGTEIFLSAAPGHGRRVAGRLEGHFRPDAFLYDVVSYTWIAVDGERRSIDLHAVPDAEGRFDLGWLPDGKADGLRVTAGPEGPCPVYNDVVDPRAGAPDARIVELPFHDRVTLRVEGAPSYAFGKAPHLQFRKAGDFAGSCAVSGEQGVARVLREGELVVVATADGMASAPRTIRLAPGEIPDAVVLELVADARR
jgi:hypothetical protein